MTTKARYKTWDSGKMQGEVEHVEADKEGFSKEFIRCGGHAGNRICDVFVAGI
jgi:hypothetical protein